MMPGCAVNDDLSLVSTVTSGLEPTLIILDFSQSSQLTTQTQMEKLACFAGQVFGSDLKQSFRC